MPRERQHTHVTPLFVFYSYSAFFGYLLEGLVQGVGALGGWHEPRQQVPHRLVGSPVKRGVHVGPPHYHPRLDGHPHEEAPAVRVGKGRRHPAFARPKVTPRGAAQRPHRDAEFGAEGEVRAAHEGLEGFLVHMEEVYRGGQRGIERSDQIRKQTQRRFSVKHATCNCPPKSSVKEDHGV